MSSSATGLCPELWDHVFKYLSGRDLCQVRRTCRFLNKAAKNNGEANARWLWECAEHRVFGLFAGLQDSPWCLGTGSRYACAVSMLQSSLAECSLRVRPYGASPWRWSHDLAYVTSVLTSILATVGEPLCTQDLERRAFVINHISAELDFALALCYDEGRWAGEWSEEEREWRDLLKSDSLVTSDPVVSQRVQALTPPVLNSLQGLVGDGLTTLFRYKVCKTTANALPAFLVPQTYPSRGFSAFMTVSQYAQTAVPNTYTFRFSVRDPYQLVLSYCFVQNHRRVCRHVRTTPTCNGNQLLEALLRRFPEMTFR